MKLTRELRIFIAATLSLALLASLITVAVSLATRRPAAAEETAQPLPAIMERLSFSDLAFPEDYISVWKERWYPSRPPLARWSWEQVLHFWKDPRITALSEVSARNDRQIQALFKEVP